jgi:hypothetical protein
MHISCRIPQRLLSQHYEPLQRQIKVKTKNFNSSYCDLEVTGLTRRDKSSNVASLYP